MAKIKHISLQAIASLSKAITFSTWKGIPYLKKATGKISGPRSPAVLKTNSRWKIACRVLKTLDASIIVGYKMWAAGSTYTWKDLFMAQYMRYWATYNQAPITVTKIEYRWVYPTLMCCFWYGNYFALPGEGWGTIAYGSSPYGHREKYFGEDGWPVKRVAVVRYGEEPSRNWEPGATEVAPGTVI